MKVAHRVQRVPKTETQGRVHTSTATVLVMPEIEGSTSTLTRKICVSIFIVLKCRRTERQQSCDSRSIVHEPTGIKVEMGRTESAKTQIKL